MAGPCSKIHDLKLKESFEKSPRHDAYVSRFESELAQYCEKLAMDLDRKVRRGQERLAQEVDMPLTGLISSEKSEQLSVLEEKIKKLLEQIENLGEAGKVDEAEALMRKVDLLNADKAILTQNDKLALTQEKKMALCEICGSFLVANDAAERIQSHVSGKQHIGYGMVRDFINEFKVAKEKKRDEERLAKEREAEERRKLREKESDHRGRSNEMSDRERDRHRERNFDRERSHGWTGRGSLDVGRGLDLNHNQFRRGRDWDRERFRRNGEMSRDRARGRSRSRSPVRHSYRK